jgi:hypothetical protein
MMFSEIAEGFRALTRWFSIDFNGSENVSSSTPICLRDTIPSLSEKRLNLEIEICIVYERRVPQKI